MNSNVAFRPRPARPCRRGRLYAAGRALRGLCLLAGLVCVAAASASAQQAVGSSALMECGSKKYAVRLVKTEVKQLIVAGRAKHFQALGIVLTPADGAAKAFFLYWLGEQGAPPTKRENTDGSLAGNPMPYDNGKIGNTPYAEDFFKVMKCPTPTDDERVKKIQELLEGTQPVPDVLNKVAGALSGVGDVGQAEVLTGDGQTLFDTVVNESTFVTATRQYAGKLPAPHAEVTTDTSKGSGEEGKEKPTTESETVKKTVSEPENEKKSLFGGAPTWLVVGFFITSAVTLAVLGFVGWGFYKDRKGGADLVGGGAEPPGPGADEEAKAVRNQAARISGTLAGIIGGADNRVKNIRAGVAQNTHAKGHDSLAAAVFESVRSFIEPRNDKRALALIETALSRAKGAPGVQSAREWENVYDDVLDQLVKLKRNLGAEAGSGASVPVGAVVEESVPEGAVVEESVQPPPTTTTSQVSPATAASIQLMANALNRLSTDVAALKTSVDGHGIELGAISQVSSDVGVVKRTVESVDSKLAEYFALNRGFQMIGTRWFGASYTGGRSEELARDVAGVIDMYRDLSKWCGNNATSVSQTRECLVSTLERLNSIREHHLKDSLGETILPPQIAAKIDRKLSDNETAVNEYKAIEASVRSGLGTAVRAREGVATLLQERTDAREKLGRYHPGSDFARVIEAVTFQYDGILEEVKRVYPNPGGSLRAAVGALATGYLEMKPAADSARDVKQERDILQEQLTREQSQSEAGRELAREVALALNFKDGGEVEGTQAAGHARDLLRKEREAGVHLRLRLGLSSALMSLEQATANVDSGERADLIEALFLEKVKKGIRALLAEMGEYSGDELWRRGIYEGFSQKWLHYLLRADLLLSIYYAEQREFVPLRKAVSLASSALLAALYEFQVEVVEVGLFGKLPDGMDTEAVYAGLRSLPAVREKVRLKLLDIQTGEVVVDITSFPYRVGGVRDNGGRASTVNPSAWQQG